MNKKQSMIRGLTTFITISCCAFIASALKSDASPLSNPLPEKIAATYVSYISPHKDGDLQKRIVENVLDPMAQAGFNVFNAKIQPVAGRKQQFDLSDPKQRERIQLLAEACKQRGISLVAYTFHYPHSGRDPKKHEKLAPVVTVDGRVLEKQFAVADWENLLYMTSGVFELAKASLDIPIAGVGWDIEKIQSTPVSFDDDAWSGFAKEKGLDVGLAPELRGRHVIEKKLFKDYQKYYEARWDQLVKKWVEEIHAINPSLSLSFMPVLDRWHHYPFFRYAATEKAPAVFDHWGMYNSSGLTDEWRQWKSKLKGYNPHNRYVQWFRCDSYRASDIRVQAYHTLRELDGYCSGNIWHIVPSRARVKNPADYWSAFAEANRMERQDRQTNAEAPSIPFEPVTPQVATIPELSEPIVQLEPHGNGTGKDQWIPLRTLHQILIHATAGETIDFDVRHLAGERRPLALQFKLVQPGGEILFNDSVMPGKTRTLKIEAPTTGTYGLYVTGGETGQAWYAVKVRNKWHALSFAYKNPYLFFSPGVFPVSLWFKSQDAPGDVVLSINPGKGALKVSLNNEAPHILLRQSVNLEFPPNRSKAIKVSFDAPKKNEILGKFHVQNIFLNLKGPVYPYAGVSEERLLLPGRSAIK